MEWAPWELLALPGLLSDWHTYRTPDTLRCNVEHGQRQDDEHTEQACPQWGTNSLASEIGASKHRAADRDRGTSESL